MARQLALSHGGGQGPKAPILTSSSLHEGPAAQAILMNKEDTTRVRLVFANQTEADILLRCVLGPDLPHLHAGRCCACSGTRTLCC